MMRRLSSHVGPYELGGRLGSTGEAGDGANVFYASRGGAGRVLHRVPRPSDAAASGPALDGFRAASALNPVLPRLVEWFDDGDERVLVFVPREGVSLARLLSHLAVSGERMGDAALWHFAHELARGLVACHEGRLPGGNSAPVVHGTLAAEHVLLTWDGEVMVMGLCPLVRGVELPGERTLRPSSAWLAPEVARGERPSAQADVYALAAMVRALLVGEARPSAGSAAASMQLVRPDLPASLALALDRGLAERPEERGSIADLARVLALQASAAPEGAVALRDAIAPFESLDALLSSRRPPNADDDLVGTRVVSDPTTEGGLEETFPTLPRELRSAAVHASTPRPEPTTRPSDPSTSPAPDDGEATTSRPPDGSVPAMAEDDLEGTLVIGADEEDLHATQLVQPAPLRPRLPQPRLGPAKAPPAAPGMMTVVDDAFAPSRRPSLLPKTPAFAPVPSSAPTPPTPPEPSRPLDARDGRELDARSSAAVVDAAPVTSSATHSSEPLRTMEGGPDSLAAPSRSSALPELSAPANASTPASLAPESTLSATRGAGVDAAAHAVLSTASPHAAPPKSLPDRNGRPPRSKRSRRSKTVIAVLFALLVTVWGLAFALYLRGGRARFAMRAPPVAPSAAPSLPEPIVASNVPRPEASSNGAVSPPSAAVSEAADAAPSASASAPEPSADPSAAASVDAAPPSSPAPTSFPVASGAERAPLSFEGNLVVRSSIDANVYVQGSLVGRTNQRLLSRCRWRNVRLGVEPGPFWISTMQVVYVPCLGLHTMTLEPDSSLIAAEKSRPR